MTTTVRFRDLAGGVILDLSSAGYEVDFDGVMVGSRRLQRQTAMSPWVDGDVPVYSRFESTTAELTLRCVGATRSEVHQRYLALLAAAEAPSYLLEVVVDDVAEVWRASSADSAAGYPTAEVLNYFRTVALTIPVQPTPSVTIPEGV